MNELLRENNINVFLRFRPVEGFDFQKKKKKTVKTGEYPRQKSLIKYSTMLKTTLERNKNEKHFLFLFFFFLYYRKALSLESSSVCIDLFDFFCLLLLMLNIIIFIAKYFFFTSYPVALGMDS